MGTRGLVGFRIDDTLKMAYNHSDSYPSHLGVRTLEWLWNADLSAVREQARALRLAEDGEKPTTVDIERPQPWTDTSVSSGQLDEWYVLLRRAQGEPEQILRSGVIEDGMKYGGIEWIYLIDLDANVFAVYEGEIAGEPVDAWPLDDLPTGVALLALDVDADA